MVCGGPECRAKFVPDILVTGGSDGGGALERLAATAMRFLAANAPLRAATGKQPPLGGAPLPPPKVWRPRSGCGPFLRLGMCNSLATQFQTLVCTSRRGVPLSTRIGLISPVEQAE